MLPYLISLRRFFLYLLVLPCCLFMVLNVGQFWSLTMTVGEMVPPMRASPRGSAPRGPPPEDAAVFRRSLPMAASVEFSPQLQDLEADPERILLERSSVAVRPWFMAGGTRRPAPAVRSRKTGRRVARLWPQEAPDSDRITNQLMFVPPEPTPSGKVQDYLRKKRIIADFLGELKDESENRWQPQLKTILLYGGPNIWGRLTPGSSAFLKAKCPVDACAITYSWQKAETADLMLFRNTFYVPQKRPPKQIWATFYLESPYNIRGTFHRKNSINWTFTYRHDSDIVTPYAKWVYYNESIKQKTHMNRNYAANKTRKVAWFASHCRTPNNRQKFVHELMAYIEVHIYGSCGEYSCPRFDERCLKMLDRHYKFYLAFENSNCIDYITEKLYTNGLQRDVLPVVMGARPEDYARSAPYHSYIHVDEFDSPRDLAAYLLRLDADDDLYNTYFRWKGTGEFINTLFFCRLCAMLYDDFPVKSYRNLKDWWAGRGTCSRGSWKVAKNLEDLIPGKF